MKKFVVLALLPLGVLHAAPGRLTQSLMQEPATLFDIGMMRLEALATEFENSAGIRWSRNPHTGESSKADVHTEYDADADRIYVSFFIMNSVATYDEMESSCGAAFRNMGIWLAKSLTDLFSHVGEQDASKLRNLSEGLPDMTIMTCYVSSDVDTSEERFRASLSLRDFLQGGTMTLGSWE